MTRAIGEDSTCELALPSAALIAARLEASAGAPVSPARMSATPSPLLFRLRRAAALWSMAEACSSADVLSSGKGSEAAIVTISLFSRQLILSLHYASLALSLCVEFASKGNVVDSR
jgi:hypothetical protein